MLYQFIAPAILKSGWDEQIQLGREIFFTLCRSSEQVLKSTFHQGCQYPSGYTPYINRCSAFEKKKTYWRI